MRTCMLFLLCCGVWSCSPTTYYIVRHAEKETATMVSDVPLSNTGRQRAVALKELLTSKNIGHIFATDYNRTRSTAQPLSDATGIRIALYHPGDSTFLMRLKNISRANVLVVGHSNTVDDLVNGLTGKMLLQDLPDTRYGDVFIVTKRGKTYRYATAKFGL